MKKHSKSASRIVNLILTAIGLAMGVAVAVLGFLGNLDSQTGFMLLGVGVASIGIVLLDHEDR